MIRSNFTSTYVKFSDGINNRAFFLKKNLLLRSKYFMKNWMLINNLNFFSIHKFLSGQNEKSPKDQFFFSLWHLFYLFIRLKWFSL